MQEKTLITSVQHKSLKQKLGAPFLLWFVCVLITFVMIYTVAWFGFRNDPDLQGTQHWFLRYKVGDVAQKLAKYKEHFGQYPESLLYLYGNIKPDETIPEQDMDQLINDRDNDTRLIGGMYLKYERIGDTFTLSHFGKDAKEGGVGIYKDITYKEKDIFPFMRHWEGQYTSPTFRQFMFEMNGSFTIFKSALWVNLILLFAMVLQFSRSTSRLSIYQALLYVLLLTPACVMIAMTLTIYYLASANTPPSH